jgi:hypothetical protein
LEFNLQVAGSSTEAIQCIVTKSCMTCALRFRRAMLLIDTGKRSERLSAILASPL